MTESLPVTTILGWCAAAGILFGSIMAIAQRDFKRMLAYSTVAQVSYIGLGIGLANSLGLIGALLHILNHAFMKSCLFLVVGGIRHQTGLREIPWFSGLGRHMPLMMAAFSMAALSMVGIPPTAGFFSNRKCIGSPWPQIRQGQIQAQVLSFWPQWPQWSFRIQSRVPNGSASVPYLPPLANSAIPG